jgi:HEAT repeat protein
MEFVIIYSIIIFSILIISLYLYLFYERVKEKRRNRAIIKNESAIEQLLDNIISKIEQQEVNDDEIYALKSLLNDELTAQILTEKFIHYIESFRGTFLQSIINLSEEIGLVDYQIKKLNTRNVNDRILAIKNLGELRSKKGLEPILKMLNSSNPEQIYSSLKAISNIGDEEYFIKAFNMIDENIILSERSLIEIADSFKGDKSKVYLELMKSDKDFVSTVFIKSAGNFRDSKLLDEIYKFLNDKNNEKKIAAVRAFGNIGDNRYLDDIIKLLDSDSWELRSTCAKVLGQINDKKAIEALVGLLKDENYYVRRNAANSIIHLDGGLESAKEILQGDDKFAKDIIINAIETAYSWNELVEYDKKTSEPKLTKLITDYIENE